MIELTYESVERKYTITLPFDGECAILEAETLEGGLLYTAASYDGEEVDWLDGQLER